MPPKVQQSCLLIWTIRFKRLGSGTGIMSPYANRRVWPVPPDAVSASISQAPEILKVTFFGENGEQTSLNFRRYRSDRSGKRNDDLFACYNSDQEPRLRFMAEPELGGSLVFLLRAEDDSLIVQWRNDLSQISIWWRYPLRRDVQ